METARRCVYCKNNYLAEMFSGSEEGSYLRLIDFLSLDSRLESNKEEKKKHQSTKAPKRIPCIQGFSADPFYGRARCSPMVGRIQNLKDLKT